MRTIQKGPQPNELIDWAAKNAGLPQNLRYDEAGFPKEAVRRSLLNEQLHLCAYALKALRTRGECEMSGRDTSYSCHIEHYLPQSRGIAAESISYQNMLACYPPGGTVCDYGAQRKADFDPSQGSFVSPLTPGAESHFSFDTQGYIDGKTHAGSETVRILNLNHPALVSDRASAIRGFLHPRGKPLSAAAARRVAEQVLQPGGTRRLPAYCTAIAAAALAHAEREEARALSKKKAHGTGH